MKQWKDNEKLTGLDYTYERNEITSKIENVSNVSVSKGNQIFILSSEPPKDAVVSTIWMDPVKTRNFYDINEYLEYFSETVAKEVPHIWDRFSEKFSYNSIAKGQRWLVYKVSIPDQVFEIGATAETDWWVSVVKSANIQETIPVNPITSTQWWVKVVKSANIQETITFESETSNIWYLFDPYIVRNRSIVEGISFQSNLEGLVDKLPPYIIRSISIAETIPFESDTNVLSFIKVVNNASLQEQFNYGSTTNTSWYLKVVNNASLQEQIYFNSTTSAYKSFDVPVSAYATTSINIIAQFSGETGFTTNIGTSPTLIRNVDTRNNIGVTLTAPSSFQFNNVYYDFVKWTEINTSEETNNLSVLIPKIEQPVLLFAEYNTLQFASAWQYQGGMSSSDTNYDVSVVVAGSTGSCPGIGEVLERLNSQYPASNYVLGTILRVNVRTASFSDCGYMRFGAI